MHRVWLFLLNWVKAPLQLKQKFKRNHTYIHTYIYIYIYIYPKKCKEIYNTCNILHMFFKNTWGLTKRDDH
ncbi:MAG: hypothetical protein N7Q72_04180, partial [Spiroplasma sp. Tabriz.8]|nr:hypothetical protein [Spiroplasma sp. Tabriz.8]